MKILEQINIELRNDQDQLHQLHIDVYDSSLSRKWLTALNHLLADQYHLEKNYCFMGFAAGPRDGVLILDQVNQSISAVNQARLGYTIDDYFSMANTITDEPDGEHVQGRNIVHDRLNRLHRYFEDLQGQSGRLSPYYLQADAATRWHIRQLNLLCHEFESWALSWRKQIEAPDWQRPSQLMCWLNAPRFQLDDQDFELFGVDALLRSQGGVFVGVNKSVGKHHWEVFCDEGRDSRVGELVTSSLISQTQAAGDFDIEWGRNTSGFEWKQRELQHFRDWLTANGFDPADPALTIGHPQVAQVDLLRSFGTEDPHQIWAVLNTHLDVYSVSTSTACATYPYRWSDSDFVAKQISIISQGH
jgi:hypothetical protein